MTMLILDRLILYFSTGKDQEDQCMMTITIMMMRSTTAEVRNEEEDHKAEDQ